MRCRGDEVAAIVSSLALIALLLGGCGEPSVGPSTAAISRYPGATLGETLEASAPFGLFGGHLEQYTTRDSYEDVLAFYRESLRSYDPEVVTHETPQGRQTALSIDVEGGGITVAIQEFREEDAVNITLMAAGS